MTKRIVSLLPSATEIVCALGAREQLVGRSHECDYPPGVEALPALTTTKVKPSPSSAEIDRSVRDVVKQALAVYDVDTDLLRKLAPDVIVTQDLCDVCAVSLEQVKKAAAEITGKDVTVVNLRPVRLADIWADIRRVAAAIGRETEAEVLVKSLEGRCNSVRERALFDAARPTVLTIEWIDPVMIGGTWMPELVELAAGKPLVTTAGQKAPTIDRAALDKLDPDMLVVKPCGFPLARTLAETETLRRNLPWDDWDAPLNGRVYVVDGNAYFNRPGPRIVDSLEILAACVHPKQFRDFRRKYAESVVEVERDLNVKRWSEEYIGLP